MPPKDRARKAAFLCCHFARNLAYYTAARKVLVLDKEGFWFTVAGNFVDACALEWCKLFGNLNDKYHWRNVFAQPDIFKQTLLKAHGLSEAELEKLRKEIKDYRDGFVAHLDVTETTRVPSMSTPYLLVEFFYEKLLHEFETLQSEASLPKHIDRYYDLHLKEAAEIFERNKTVASQNSSSQIA